MSLFSPPSIQQQLDLLGPRAGAATVRDDESVDMYEDMEDDAVPSQPRVFPRRLDISGGPVHMRAVSLPAPTPPRMTPDPSSSPAARFLSGFYSPATLSPAASPQVQLPPVEPEPDAEGLEIAGFVLGRELGRGGFSLIRQATNQNTGAVVAVKVVRQPEPNAEHAEHRRTQLQRETDLWRQLSHEHVLPLFSAHTTFRATYFITQFCPAGTLYDILRKDGKPTMDDAGMMFRQVVRGLRYLHEIARVVHGDMKLENVLVDEFGTCKISDFGMARAFDETDADITGDSALDSSSSDDAEPVQTSHSRRQTLPGLTVHLSLMRSSRHNRPSMPSSSMSQSQLAQARQHVQPGSLPYAAPELLMPVTRRRKAGHSGPGQDVWAVGVMLYVLLTGVFPFADTFEPRVRRKILAGTYETPSGIGKAAAAVLGGCLQLDLRYRWTARVVDEAAWAVGWADVANADDDTPTPQPQSQPSTSTSSSGGRSVSRARPGLNSRSRSRAAATGVGPIRTSRSGSAVRPTTRSTSRCSGSELAKAMELALPALTLSPPSATERRGRTRHRDIPSAEDDEAEVSRSPSGPTTPPDDVSPRGGFGGPVEVSTSEGSVSSGERRRVTFPDEDWKNGA